MAISAGLGSIISGGLGLIGGIATNRANAKEAASVREFNERMSRNKHQYETEDLKKAGLNRILSATQGASAGSSSAQAQFKNPVSDSVQAAATAAQMALTKSQTALTNRKIVSENGLPQNIIGEGLNSTKNLVNPDKNPQGINTGDLALGALGAYATAKGANKAVKIYKTNRKYSKTMRYDPKTGEVQPTKKKSKKSRGGGGLSRLGGAHRSPRNLMRRF